MMHFLAKVFNFNTNHHLPVAQNDEQTSQIEKLMQELSQLKNDFNVLKKQFDDEHIGYVENTPKNYNLVNLLLANCEDVDLMYIQTPVTLFIFSKQIFQSDSYFFHDYLLKNVGWDQTSIFRIMPKTCQLYREHIEMFTKENVLCCKYINRVGLVAKSIISIGNNYQDIYIESHYLGLENYKIDQGRKFVDVPKRKILSGTTVGSYLKGINLDEQKIFLKIFFDWLFLTYQLPEDSQRVKGIVCDSNLDNFLILNNKFILIDHDFIGNDIEKSLCLWYTLLAGQHPLYIYFADLYGLQKFDKECPHPLALRNVSLEKAAILNKDLIEKYFTEKMLVPGSAIS